MTPRSNRADVRNPVLALPAIRALQALDPEIKALLSALLLDLRRDARARSERSWASRKAYVAAYWAAISTYSGHIVRALRQGSARRKPNVMIVRQAGYPDLEADDWADASRLFSERREESGLGASLFPDAILLLGGIPVGRISYNGRIWPLGEWRPDTTPIFDNRQQEA